MRVNQVQNLTTQKNPGMSFNGRFVGTVPPKDEVFHFFEKDLGNKLSEKERGILENFLGYLQNKLPKLAKTTLGKNDEFKVGLFGDLGTEPSSQPTLFVDYAPDMTSIKKGLKGSWTTTLDLNSLRLAATEPETRGIFGIKNDSNIIKEIKTRLENYKKS